MNNDAFRDLVRKRVEPKSTREIAREAVQAEFRRKRRRGGDSSDEDDSRYNKQKKHKERVQEEEFNDDSTYRDRAKERRDGKQPLQEDDLPEDTTEDLDNVLREATRTNETVDKKHFAETKAEALVLLDPKSSTLLVPRTTMGKSFLSVLQSHYFPDHSKEAAPSSTFSFTLRAHPGDIARAWEIPFERTAAPVRRERCSPLTSSLLEQIGESFTRRQRRQEDETNKKNAPKIKEAEEDESEDDIFGDAGDYDPTATSNRTMTSYTTAGCDCDF